jgi:hypothetical protein
MDLEALRIRHGQMERTVYYNPAFRAQTSLDAVDQYLMWLAVGQRRMGSPLGVDGPGGGERVLREI